MADELPIIRLGKWRDDSVGVDIGETNLFLMVEYRGPMWWRFRIRDFHEVLDPRTAWVNLEKPGDFRASHRAKPIRDVLKAEYHAEASQVLEQVIGIIQDNEETWMPQKDEETEKKSQEPSFDEETIAKAHKLLQNPTFFYKLGKVFDWGFQVPKLNKPRFVIGEERNKRLLGPLLIGASKLNMTSIIKMLGNIATAKDSMLRLWLELLPIKSVERSYMTAASLRYSQNLQGAELIYIPDSPELKGETGRHLRFMRADDGGLISEYAMKDRETGEMITKTVRVPVKGVATTSNAVTGDAALESGMWTLETNDSQELTHRVKKEKLKLRAGKRLLFPEDELKVWKCAFNILLSEEPVETLPKVPFAESLIIILESSRSESRRDPDKLCDLISLIAWMRRFQKPMDKRDEADLIDFYLALQIGLDAITETISELGKKEQAIFEVVKHSEAATIRLVADETGIPYKTCYPYLERLVEKGFLNKDKEKGRNIYSVLSGKMPKELLISKGSSFEEPKDLMEFILSSFHNFSPSHLPTPIIFFDPIKGDKLTVECNSNQFKITSEPVTDENKYYPYPAEKVRSSEAAEETISKEETEAKNFLPSQTRSSEQVLGEKKPTSKTLTIRETLVLLRTKWQKGYTQDFDKLIMETKGCDLEEAEQLRQKWFDEGLIAYDPEGWLVWIKSNPHGKLVKCPKCGADTPEAAAFCRSCGWRLPTSYG